jgi:hypothetical protein
VTRSPRFFPLLIVVIVVVGFALVAWSYWPGVMVDDARWQYQQSVDNSYEDWHPPLMAWAWRRVAFIIPGPAPMLLLQLLLYWAGIALIAWWAHRRGQRGLAVAIACAGWLPAPLALTGSVLKDVLMAGFLLVSTGLLLCRTFVRRDALRAAMSLASFLCLFTAAALRLNAVFACLPLLLAALPVYLTRTRLRLAASTILAAAAFLMVGPAVAALVQAETTKVDLSLKIFDLGGITEHSGVSVFPEFGVRDPVAVNRLCYDPDQWDGYSTWAKRPCPLGFARFDELVDEGDVSVTRLWLNAILSHPLAYAEHRLDHFNRSVWFLVPDSPAFTASSRSVANPWGFQVRPNATLTAISGYADTAAVTPLGWPIFWISVALAALIVSLSAKMAMVVRALPASAFLYGLSYLVVGVAVGMRYYFWTITGAALAVLVLAAELRARRQGIGRRTLVVAVWIVAVPTLMAVAGRLALP